MVFTDIFIKRPVLATVVSLLILVLGLRSIFSLPIRQYPFTQNAVVTVTTSYTGADPSLVAGFITTPLENSVAQANGIDYLTSSSTEGTSTINANLLLNYDPDKALSEINTKVNAVLNQLPKSSQLPIITIATGETIDSMYIGFYSDVLPPNKISDYLIRVVQPKFQAVDGVQVAEILGNREFAMRAWLDPAKLSSYRITSEEVATVLLNNDFISAVGRTDGNMVVANLTADTGLSTVNDFRKLVIKSQDGAIIRLGDVANVTLGSINYDSTKYVKSSIDEVEKSLIEALVIVTIVIFLFLGSLRSVIIPVVAIPLSLIGAFFIMLLLHYSINLLTLLALVLAIGLVVDDAIIVVENVYRHIEDGMTGVAAALQGARELA